jgi:NADPH-dependent curcumin reductase CurA
MTSLASTTNHQIRLARRPVGLPVRADWSFTAEPLAAPEPGGVVVKTLLLSLDPAMRGWMNEGKSYIAPVAIDEVMRAGGIGVVVASESAKFAIGDHVSGALGVQEYATFGERQLGRGELVKIDLRVAAPTQWLNVLGMPGMTGYFGLMDVGQPKPGETVVVAAASGAVGSAVGQIAKIKGARAVGIAGGKEKCAYVKNELGFDECLDHRDPDLASKLKDACPKGIDVYFENVGGAVFDAVFPQLNAFARMPVCGLIAEYNNFGETSPKWAGKMMRAVLTKRLTIRGFIVSDFAARHGDFLRDMSGWVREGKVKHKEFVTEGLDSAPTAFMGLLKGANFGKQLVRVGPDKA